MPGCASGPLASPLRSMPGRPAPSSPARRPSLTNHVAYASMRGMASNLKATPTALAPLAAYTSMCRLTTLITPLSSPDCLRLHIRLASNPLAPPSAYTSAQGPTSQATKHDLGIEHDGAQDLGVVHGDPEVFQGLLVKLNLATFMPALSSFSSIGTDLDAGPSPIAGQLLQDALDVDTKSHVNETHDRLQLHGGQKPGSIRSRPPPPPSLLELGQSAKRALTLAWATCLLEERGTSAVACARCAIGCAPGKWRRIRNKLFHSRVSTNRRTVLVIDENEGWKRGQGADSAHGVGRGLVGGAWAENCGEQSAKMTPHPDDCFVRCPAMMGHGACTTISAGPGNRILAVEMTPRVTPKQKPCG
ncbi:hypothetical protein MUK42_36862 [Musa troglodytarum]|uniref:Uncharacterized protein n=1 Tax=Musa troglodytarum TaxID=320322 RepID=A0A9E7JBX2_9LILI|nr:hypothetical protein MUK42_36862 [Musa troglodytarum]